MSVKQIQGHASDEELLRAIDGELERHDRAEVERHIASCWGCRHRYDQYLQVMGRFTEFEVELSASDLMQPPEQWRAFPGRLHRAATVPAAAPASQRGSLVLGAAAVAVIAVWLWPARPLSAKEVLHRSSQSETAALRSVQDRVVLQRVRVESRRRRAEGAFWNAPAGRKSHRHWVTSGEGVASELERVYQRNGLDVQQPISVANHQTWREHLPHRSDAVEASGDYLRIRTRNEDHAAAGQIQQAELVVRASDWHPVEQTITVAGSIDSYRVVEMGYEVKPMTTEIARLFQPDPSTTLGALPAAPAIDTQAAPVVPEFAVVPAAELPDPKTLASSELQALALLRELEAERREAARVELQAHSVSVTLYAGDPERAALLTSRLKAVPHVQVNMHMLDAGGALAPGAGVEIAPESSESPLFLRDLVANSGSLQAANLVVSHQMELLRRLKAELGGLSDVTARFPAGRQEDLPESAQQRLRVLQQSYFDTARQVWRELKASSPVLLSAMGLPGGDTAPALAACVWPQTAADLNFGARRLEELHSRAFTSVAGADTSLRWMSRGALREETAALYAALDHSFADPCRP